MDYKTDEIAVLPVSFADGSMGAMQVAIYRPECAPSGVCFFCLPGGASSRRYFDLGSTVAADLSFARLMTARGHHVAAMDVPGTGDNALPDDHPFLLPRTSAGYIAAVAKALRGELGEGARSLVGTGHSMGGMLTVLAQADCNPFDAVCLMGSGAGGLEWGLDEQERQFIDRPAELERALPDLVQRKFGCAYPDGGPGPRTGSNLFGGEDDAANDFLRAAVGPLFGAGGIMAMTKGSFRAEAAALDCPTFFLFGENDIGDAPSEVPRHFTSLTDFQLLVLPCTGHNHFGYRTIGRFAERLDRWVETVC